MSDAFTRAAFAAPQRTDTLSEAGENVLPGSNPGDGRYQAAEAGASLEPASLSVAGVSLGAVPK